MSKLYAFSVVIKKGMHKLFITSGLKQSLGKCGKNVDISHDCDFKGMKHIYIGDHSSIGPYALFWSTHANIFIGNHVLFGPRVTIVTGDHRTDVLGCHIIQVKEKDKLPENDRDVAIKDGSWIGANVTILKGVTIGEGCVIAAGSVVTKSTDDYGIYAGTPAKKIKDRFTAQEQQKHIQGLKVIRREGENEC